MSRKNVSLLSCLLLLAVSGISYSHAEVRQSPATKKINEQNVVALPGHIHPLAIARYDRGRVADSLQLPHMVLVLKRSDQQEQALTTLIDQLHDPKSPMYHRWLTPQEFGQFFGPSNEDLQKLTNWLEGSGFKVDEVSPGRTTIIFSGNAAEVHHAFGIEIHAFQVNGVRHIANVTNPQIPAALAPLVAGFRSLNDFQAKPMHHVVGGFTRDKATGEWKQSSTVAPNLTSLSGPMGDARLVGPQDFYTIYNLKPLLQSGINGAGQTIAVIEQSDVNPADVTAFRSQFGLPAYPAAPNAAEGGVNYLKGVSGYCVDPGIVASGDEAEAILDVEWAGAVAPNATIDVVSCASSGSSQGTDLALTYIVNHLASSVSAMSYSYGACEAALGGASNAFYRNTYQQAVAQGQTVVVSTGDGGAPGCDNFAASAPNPATQGNAVNGLASTPYNVAAGGTDFSDVYQNLTSAYWDTANGPGYSSARSYIPETAWNGSCAGPVLRSYAAELGLNPGATPEAWCNNANFKAKYGSFVFLDGGGGGVSTLYAKPNWQSAYGVPNDAKRDLPDVSLFASNFIYNHALAVCQSDKGYSCDMSNSTAAQTMAAGGTSFVAPQVAGLIALVNQKTNARQGQANYTLYALAASEYGAPATPNSSLLSACNGSQKGNGVGTSCMFYDVNATPNPSGGTVTDSISQPCAAGTPNCVATLKKDAYGLLSSSSGTQNTAYPVGKGYDLATGLGSINFTNLVNNWTVGSSAGTTSYPTTTTLTAAPSTIPWAGVTTLIARVTNSTYASPSGVVNFYSGSANGKFLGTATLAPGKAPIAIATFQVTGAMLSPGANSLIAVFPGDGANDAASTSAAATVNVGLAPAALTTPTITLTSSAASLFLMQSANVRVTQRDTLTATLSPSDATGTVQFFLGSTSLGTAAISGGTATLGIDSSLLALGANNLTATYLGSAQYNPASTSMPTIVMVLNNTASFGSVAVGSTSPTQQFQVTFLAATAVGAINDLTVGSSNQDYLDGGSTTCAAGSYAAGANCVVSLAYAPSVPGTLLGSAVLYDAANTPIAAIPLTGLGMAARLSFGFAAPAAIASSLNGPSSVTVDGRGDIFITDTLNNRVVEIPNGGSAVNVGTGFMEPVGTAVDGAGNLYVADTAFGVSKIPNEHGNLNAAHQAPLAIAGGVFLPAEVTFDAIGNLYIADTMNNRIVKVPAVNGDLDVAHPTYLGTGLTSPNGVAVDGAGNVFIADTGFPSNPANAIYGRIVEIPGGTGAQQTLNIQVSAPSSIKIDASGQLFIADTNNLRVLQVSPDLTTQTPLNLAINATNPQYFGGIAIDLKGNLWAPDFLNNQIVSVAPNMPLLNFGNQAVCPAWLCGAFQTTFGPLTATLTNVGNQTAQNFSANLPQYFSVQGGTCNVMTPGFTLNAGGNCSLSVVFTVTDWFQGQAYNQPASVSATGTTANFLVYGFTL
ncbi:MAG TPA: protease pro-enzyme activation domain-containing protein [Acidisarcina sp.]|nr:protease pro-enzyme activation domain-containing protein [Acidisarcina sp.]